MIKKCALCGSVLGKLHYIVRMGASDHHGGIRWTRLVGFYCLHCAQKLSFGETHSDILSEMNEA